MHRPSLLDLAIAIGLFGVGIVEVLGAELADDVVEGPVALNLAAVALTTLPLALRREAAFPVAATIFGAIAVRALASEPLEIYPPAIAALVAIYSVAAHGTVRDAIVGAGIFGVALAIAADRGTGGDAAPQLVPSYILAAGVLAAGLVVSRRREAAEEQAAVAVAAERERLARELHDAVSHSLASIVMQAGGAQDIVRRDSERAAASLASIERAARSGLGEMRRLLGLIGDGSAPRAPQPTLAALDRLLHDVREAGLDVDVRVEGDPIPLPPAVDLSAYRIVQEALTNTMKHAGPCRARILVRYAPVAVEVDVTDDGRGATPGYVAGRGVTGMRERVAVLGGTFEAGPPPEGHGFSVRARIPV